MSDNHKMGRIFKWVGLIALVTVPFVVFLKRQKPPKPDAKSEEEVDIFEAELEA